MNKKVLKNDLLVSITIALLVSLLAWSLGFRYIGTVHAASLTNISDTLSDSRPGFGANHTITYINPSSTLAGQTISYTFDPNTSLFGGISNVTSTNVTSTSMTIVTVCSGGSNRVTVSSTPTTVTFTVCTGNTVNSGTITLNILNNVITNPTSTGSYIIRIGGTQSNGGDTRIAIVNAVNVTASVATTFTFTVAGLATSTSLGNNATTTGLSTSSSLAFGTISPNTHAELGQQLTVTTNATNGFAVTVHEDQDPTSNTGNKIHLFPNSFATPTPISWASPSGTINSNITYGHFGITSDDTSGTVNFGSSTPLYAGSFNPTSTLTVFAWTGPADGVTQNVGTAKVAYRIEISPLQPAANDYTDNIIYVATPVF